MVPGLIGPCARSNASTSAAESAKVLVNAIRKQLRPRDIITRNAIENAVTLIMATGGSTNAVLHLLAVAREAQVPITIERIQQVGERVPLLANLQPHGPFAMGRLHAIGGVPVVMKELLRAGLLHGDCITITGRTLAEELAEVPSVP